MLPGSTTSSLAPLILGRVTDTASVALALVSCASAEAEAVRLVIPEYTRIPMAPIKTTQSTTIVFPSPPRAGTFAGSTFCDLTCSDCSMVICLLLTPHLWMLVPEPMHHPEY